jgi:CO/xanthine dehydrogenase FAD-binding subunit
VGIRAIGNFEYIKPGTLRETLRLLGTKVADVKILAGGTDLVLQMKQGKVSPTLVIDIKNVP